MTARGGPEAVELPVHRGGGSLMPLHSLTQRRPRAPADIGDGGKSPTAKILVIVSSAISLRFIPPAKNTFYTVDCNFNPGITRNLRHQKRCRTGGRRARSQRMPPDPGAVPPAPAAAGPPKTPHPICTTNNGPKISFCSAAAWRPRYPPHPVVGEGGGAVGCEPRGLGRAASSLTPQIRSRPAVS